MIRGLTRVVFLGCVLSASLLLGQFENGEVLGTVRDASGGAIPKASVTLTNRDTGIQAKASTDENGGYDFLNVRVGRYTVAVEHAGFSKFTTDITVNVQARQRVDANMQVGATTESVTVTGAAAVLETDTSEHGQVVNTAAVVELPLNGRNYADLALLSTNTVKSPMAISFGPTATPREGAFNVNGMRSTYNNFLLDGLDNNSYGTSNQGYSAQLVQPSPDSLAEFKVITSNYSAEYGRVGGAVVNAVMKSGTNQFHGSAWEFLRNTDLNATGFLFSPSVFVKPPLQRNQFGATIGGPIVKNRLFFFGDYEGLRQLQHYLNFDSIPSMTDRQGILPVPVVNPLTGVVYPANTAIPVSQLNRFAAALLSGLPPTNGPGRSNNEEALLLIRDYGDKFDAKIDGQINDRMTAFVRWSQRKDLQYFQPDLSPAPPAATATATFTPSTRMLPSATPGRSPPARSSKPASVFRTCWPARTRPMLGGPSLLSEFGIQGLPTTPNLTGGFNTQNISGFANYLGRQTSNPQFQNPTSWDPKINYSKILRRHSLKAGFEFLNIRTEILDTNPLYGQDLYTGQFSKPTCAQLGQSSSMHHRCRLDQLQPRRLHVRRSQPNQPGQLRYSQSAPAGLLALLPGRLPGQRQAHPQPRPALGFRHPALRTRQQLLQFRPHHQLHDQGHRRQPV